MLPVNTAKITPPCLPAIVLRPHLIQRLDREKEKKLILILGQAAQGKTSLAVSWINKSTMPSAWLNLDPEDSDPVNLFYALVHSLQGVFQDVDFTSTLNLPSISLGPREELPLFRDWALAVFGAIPVPVRVVFDGLERLTAGTTSFRLIQVLLDYMPSHLHFLFLSREMPPLELQALEMKGEAFILTNEELCFTPEETRQFVRELRGLVLNYKAVKRLQELTEGWIGGLVLMCELLVRVPDPLRENFISARTASQFRGEICRYFGDSIFAARPGQVQEVLIKSSILNVLEPDFIQDLLGIQNAREILQDFARKNLFVHSSFDGRKGLSFRFHQLFRDFLRTRFKTDLPLAEQQALYRRAGALSEARGDMEGALKHYLQARAYPLATAALERVGLDLVKLGRIADLSRWLEPLPQDLVQGNPWLLFYSYMTRRFKFFPETLTSLQQALTLFEQRGEVEGALHCLAYLIEAGAHGFFSPLAPLLVRAEAFLQGLTADQYPYEQATLLLQLGVGYFLRGGNFRLGFRACQNAYLLARDLGDLPLQLQAMTDSAFCLTSLGEFQEATEFWKKADRLADQCSFPDLRAWHLTVKSAALVFSGDFDQALALVQTCVEELQLHGMTFLYQYVYNARMMINIFQENYTKAEEIGEGLVGLNSATGNPYGHATALQILAINYYHKGELCTAREFAERSREMFSSAEAKAVFHFNSMNICLGLIDIHLGKITPDTEKNLQEGLNHFQGITSYLFMVDCHGAMALLKWAQGNKEEAKAHLQTALTIAQERGYRHFFLLSRADLLQLSILALELELKGLPLDCACRFLTTKVADLAGPELERLSHHTNPRVAERAWEVRRLAHRAGLPRVRVETLGGFRVWRGDSLLSDPDWEGHQPQLLLKVLLARGSRQVPLEVLMEDLWPGSSPKTARRNLTVSLHRLGKALEPALDKTFGSAYVHLKANLVCLDQELCRVDAHEFLSLCRDGEKKEKEGDDAGALTLYQEAAQKYQGDFLPEELYLPLVESRREELKGRYLEVLEWLAELHEKRGALIKAINCLKQLLKADPLLEQAYQKLMLLYARRGLRAPALKVYEACRQALRQKLDAEPDQATTSIYRKILTSA
jgi:LuxR family transcriptional regulator, maltose regulon positive regulatory protein